ncbi:MAG: 2-C-methyl-D-erythritol 4-phosphate cytidylyltransferase [Oscillospiraceae bacterium]|nr:2-C-methyl-D-erythritol 4-phosphate cytidylyltransferase [Oscillospiraceae bacterium]
MAIFRKSEPKTAEEKEKRTLSPYCTAIIAAGGSSTRMGEDKLFIELEGIPVIARTLLVFQSCDVIDEIVIVTREDSIVKIADLCAQYNIAKATKIVKGGASRMDSVLAGIAEISRKARLVAIHDGARPLVTGDIIKETVLKAAFYSAAAPYIPVKDTIKRIENGFTVGTVDRNTLASMQTPQIFKPDLIKTALLKAKEDGLSLTDDCSAVENMGVNVFLTKGSEENIKVTTPADIVLAEMILKRRSER